MDNGDVRDVDVFVAKWARTLGRLSVIARQYDVPMSREVASYMLVYARISLAESEIMAMAGDNAARAAISEMMAIFEDGVAAYESERAAAQAVDTATH